MRIWMSILLVACTPTITPGSYLCGPEQLCPEGQACNGPDNVCVRAPNAQPFAKATTAATISARTRALYFSTSATERGERWRLQKKVTMPVIDLTVVLPRMSSGSRSASSFVSVAGFGNGSSHAI